MSNDIKNEDAFDEDAALTHEISENVYLGIIKKFTLEVPGVVRFANAGFVGGIAEIMGKKNAETVNVEIEDDHVNVTVNIVVEFGCNIPETASAVQETIKSKLFEITGERVAKIKVMVSDLVDNEDVEDEVLTESIDTE